jgi:hypothetical protein
MGAVQRADRVLVDELDRDVAVIDGGRLERRGGGRTDGGIVRAGDLDLDGYDRCSREAYSS